ncbi:hypothetical protein OH76DRAFT_280967 [Lentinus brumalis]|uniref:Uncharacterized protein n=1 Tax=Lentinus brumalis TaxID=2498619 RepID=A0A371CKR7_9APHY|nr:hypothetical protein OH76DRAFT_280967 [Polyporus brumalis]
MLHATAIRKLSGEIYASYRPAVRVSNGQIYVFEQSMTNPRADGLTIFLSPYNMPSHIITTALSKFPFPTFVAVVHRRPPRPSRYGLLVAFLTGFRTGQTESELDVAPEETAELEDSRPPGYMSAHSADWGIGLMGIGSRVRGRCGWCVALVLESCHAFRCPAMGNVQGQTGTITRSTPNLDEPARCWRQGHRPQGGGGLFLDGPQGRSPVGEEADRRGVAGLRRRPQRVRHR